VNKFDDQALAKIQGVAIQFAREQLMPAGMR